MWNLALQKNPTAIEKSKPSIRKTPFAILSEWVQLKFQVAYSSMQDYREHADTYRAMLGDYGWGFNYDESEK